jgi:transcriptional regulator with XRE-family HTH domain
MTGAELRAHRKAAGLTQAALAQRAGIGRHAVSYWECRDRLDLRGWAVRRMFEALGIKPVPHFWTSNARAGGWGLSGVERIEAALEAEVARKMAEWRAREAARAARRRVICGAKTRKGTDCRNKSEPGKRRCKFHGGKSTGPRTPEGRARVAEAQRRRWARRNPAPM